MAQAEFQETQLPRPEKQRSKKHSSHVCDAWVLVHEQLIRIGALADLGFETEAREASADLLFDFQPLIVTCPELASLCASVLPRCGATALHRRFLLAAHGGDANIGPDAFGPDATVRMERQGVPHPNLTIGERRSPMPVPLAGRETQDA